ncbi:sugar transferase, partial [Herbaspirillum sp. HC18]
YWRFKRIAECLLGTLLIIALSPLFVLIAAIVALDVGMPVIFWQQRPGARGLPFRVYKFRTMAASHDATGRRISDADRISAIGAFLRHSRLDELPQLFNVLAGDMSFIGPRPLLPRDQFPGLEARLSIAPGITGWAQVNGGREISAADKAA